MEFNCYRVVCFGRVVVLSDPIESVLFVNVCVHIRVDRWHALSYGSSSNLRDCGSAQFSLILIFRIRRGLPARTSSVPPQRHIKWSTFSSCSTSNSTSISTSDGCYQLASSTRIKACTRHAFSTNRPDGCMHCVEQEFGGRRENEGIR